MPRRRTDEIFPKLDGRYFGKRLREIRITQNMSIRVLSSKVGVLETYIPQLERGEKLPSFETLIYIANALNVTTNALLCDYIDADVLTIQSKTFNKFILLNKEQQRHLEDIIELEISFIVNHYNK